MDRCASIPEYLEPRREYLEGLVRRAAEEGFLPSAALGVDGHGSDEDQPLKKQRGKRWNKGTKRQEAAAESEEKADSAAEAESAPGAEQSPRKGSDDGWFDDEPGGADAQSGAEDAASVRSEVNNSLTIVNFFHKIQNFRQISDLFSQI